MPLGKMPIQPEVRERMNEVASLIGAALPEGYGFALLVFDSNTSKGFMNYISNAERADMKRALREFLEHMESEGN